MRSAHLEPHDLFDGVGAHELNPRYDPQPGDDLDEHVTRSMVPALRRAEMVRGLAAIPIRLDGIDGSHYQYDAGPIDYPTIPGFWVAWKATQSTGYVDPTFAIVRPRLARFRNRLWYHWLSSTTAPELQAEHFLSTVGDPADGETFMVDAEEAGVTVAKVTAFAGAVERAWQRPGSIYTGAYVAGGTIWQSGTVRASHYGRRAMHLAAYVPEARARALPGVAAYPWDAWQYSSNGPVAGIVGRCDMNRVDTPDLYNTICNTKKEKPDMGVELKANSEARRNAGGGIEAAGGMMFAVGDFKRNIGAAELAERFPGVTPSLLSNAVLDAIPDAAAETTAPGISHGTWQVTP